MQPPSAESGVIKVNKQETMQQEAFCLLAQVTLSF
jgi:hypothetical protein